MNLSATSMPPQTTSKAEGACLRSAASLRLGEEERGRAPVAPAPARPRALARARHTRAMAGVKRRTSYRKTVTDDVLYGVPELPEGHRVAVLLRSHGGNLLEVRTDAGDEGIALLPTKYRKLIWIKRGDHLGVPGDPLELCVPDRRADGVHVGVAVADDDRLHE